MTSVVGQQGVAVVRPVRGGAFIEVGGDVDAAVPHPAQAFERGLVDAGEVQGGGAAVDVVDGLDVAGEIEALH
jgi:hypothetical protein